jgi:hypothetical protein
MARLIGCLLMSAIAFGPSCSGPVAPSNLPAGSWGGDHISMTVDEPSTHVELDCAHADIPGPIQLDAGNRFAAAGTFVREHGGPIRSGETPDSHPASFSGSITQARMTLAIRLTDSNEAIGSYILTRGAIGRVFKCL